MPKRLLKPLALLFAVSVLAAACGSDDEADTSTETTEASGATDETAAADAGTEDDEAMADDEDDEAIADDEDDEAIADDEDDEAMADDEAGTVVDVAVASGEFPTLVAALQAAGLDETLAGEGPFTVFAPTEEAFAAALTALDMTAEELLADETLADILTYHVVPLEAPAATVLTLDGQEVETVNGATVLVTIDGDTVKVNEATVTQTDIEASNGVIHVIDTVLLPPAS